jgi:hypothetical protein
MAIDFSNMLDDDDVPVINPRDIFFTLERQPQFSFPRDIQTEVMKNWFDNRNQRDCVIKLNVGSGKTLVGLLLLQSSINDDKGPALYVTPDKQLAQQVINEANALGIEVTDNPRDAAFTAGECICVTNVYKLFNGKSIFGVGASKIDIGTVIIDDAHACVSTITDQFRIRLENSHDAYSKIFNALSEDLKGYNQARFIEVKAGDPQAHMEVPFWSWASHQTEILQALYEHNADDELQFTHPLLKDILSQCRCVIGGQYLEIEPIYPATDQIQSFRRAKRRIYMTATLSDDSVIVTHFGANPKKLGKPIVPSSSQSMGERMIMMPQELNPDLSIIDMRSMLKDLSNTVNVVVIVPSKKSADEWATDADQVLMGANVTTGIEKLRKGHVGLTILVNRYDGIDLPGNACRVLAIVDLPEVSSYVDLIDSEVLSGSKVNLRRQVERIEQGMGRGVRSNDDYCAVLLLGAKLTSRIRSPKGQSMLTAATQAQLDLSRKMAKHLSNPSASEIKDVIDQCLFRDAGWVKISKKILVGLQADDELRLDTGKMAIRSAFDNARGNQHKTAVGVLDVAIDAENDEQVKAWLLSWKAVFQHAIDADGAQKTLVVAHAMEPGITKPMLGTTYKKLTPATGQQASRLISNHQKLFLDPTGMILFVDELCSDLKFQQETSNKFEAAINDLAMFLGIQGQRPEKDYREGPDNLWALPNGEFIIIECKNGVISNDGISKHDAGQLGQSMEWFNGRYPASQGIPVIIHPKKKLGQGASIVNEMCVIDDAGLEKLRGNIKSFSKQIADPDVAANASEVAKRLSQFELSGDTFINAFTVLVKQ